MAILKSMGRIHSKSKGKSSISLPYKRTAPSWLKPTEKKTTKEISQEIIIAVIKLAKKGFSVSKIGAELRDSQGIPQVKYVTGVKILHILKLAGLAPKIPEDLQSLRTRARRMNRHIKNNCNDKDSKSRLRLIESRISRLERYYKKSKVINVG